MSTQVQLRRGTAAENDLFTGAQGELTYCTDTKEVRIHDGLNPGGKPIDVVVDWQKPTEANNYTWYRKYASGWVEQGGRIVAATTNKVETQNLPVKMNDVYYSVFLTPVRIGQDIVYFNSIGIQTKTQTSFDYYTSTTYTKYWEVKGYAA